MNQGELKELRDQPRAPQRGRRRDFYEQAYRACRLVYDRLPSPKQIQTLVQVWKQLWKWH